MSKFFVVLIDIIMLSLAFACGIASAATLSWDYPSDEQWNTLVGYNIYYSNPAGDQFNKIIYKSDTSTNSTRVRYEDIEDKLHLQYNVEYTLWMTAFNIGEESDKSNSAIYTRDGYSPPEDNLPPAIIHISGPVTIIIGD
jgi:hypothetical protein